MIDAKGTIGINMQLDAKFKPTPDPDCRWCKGSGKVTLATWSKPCLDCLAPYEGWIWADMDGRDCTTVFYFNVDGNEVECVSVRKVAECGHEPLHPDKVNVGRLCTWARPGRDTQEDRAARRAARPVMIFKSCHRSA